MTSIDEATLKELQDKHGEVFVTDVAGREFVFRRATEIEYFRCLGAASKDQAQVPRAMHKLAHDCVIYPEMTAFSAIVTKAPGIALRIATEIMKVANGEETDLAGKA